MTEGHQPSLFGLAILGKGMKVFTVAEMVAAEKAADAQGHGYAEMMERAGRALAEAILARRDVHGRSVLVLVGPGNNGGDGLVAGRYLAEAGADVAFYLSRPRDPQTDVNLARVQAMGWLTLEAGLDQRWRVLRARLRITDILIDGLLGTGVSRPISGPLADLMRQVQAGLAERRAVTAPDAPLTTVMPLIWPAARPPAGGVWVAAVDCPSGLNCDTGELDELAFPADLTVTFAGPKRGHFLEPGVWACGELVAADIGIDPYLTAGISVEVATAAGLAAWLPTRLPQGHKGSFGFALVAGGSAGYWGAPVLAARAVLRAGAGLAALAVPGAIRTLAALQLPEATFEPLPDERDLGADSAEFLLFPPTRLQRYDAVLLGPGLGPNPDAFLAPLLAGRRLSSRLVVDADGLNYLARQVSWPQLLPAGTILTPHPGELARLLGENTPGLDRIELARQKSAEWGHILVLKGAHTLVAAPDGRCTLFPFANPALATAGSGDVLAGTIVSLLAQGLDNYPAACLGVYLHALAGQAAARPLGGAGLLAHEIADALPGARQALAQA